MTPLKRSNNIAARMGRWSAGHWKTAVFGWLGFVVLALAIGMTVGTKQLKVEDANTGGAGQATKNLNKGVPRAAPPAEVVVAARAAATGAHPGLRATVRDDGAA